MNKSAREILNYSIAATDRSRANELYNTWANKFDDDMEKVAYYGPKQLLEQFDKLNVPKNARILDVCSGTGAVARELAKRGYTDIHAYDGSEGMIRRAKKDGIYKSYVHQLYEPGVKMPFVSAEFDCVLLAAIFAPGHLPIVALREICRITKKGGVIAWINSDPAYYEDKDEQYANGGFYKLLDELTQKGYWKACESFPVLIKPYMPYSDGLVFAFEVTTDFANTELE